MALLIDKKTEILGGIEIPNFYIRLHCSLDYNGHNCIITLQPFLNKKCYKEGKQTIQIPEIKEQIIVYYNRSIDPDLELFVHNKVIELLTTPKFQNVAEINPKTGDIIIDVNGDVKFVQEIAEPSFTSQENITIVDLD